MFKLPYGAADVVGLGAALVAGVVGFAVVEVGGIVGGVVVDVVAVVLVVIGLTDLAHPEKMSRAATANVPSVFKTVPHCQ